MNIEEGVKELSSDNIPIGKLIGIILTLPFVLLFSLIILVVVIFGGNSSDSTDPTDNIGNTMAYLPIINAQSQAHGLPPLWVISDIAWESKGNWLASNQNSDGTIDAGLCQINSNNWPAYGLSDNPYDAVRNITVGTQILGANYEKYHDIGAALYAYNGGTPENGMKYNPTYFERVTNIYNMLDINPLLAHLVQFDSNSLTLSVGEATYQTQTRTMYAIDNGGGVHSTTIVIKGDRIGEDNPSSINVTIKGSHGSFGPVTVYPQSGDIAGLPKESLVYHVDTLGFELSTNDSVLITSSGGDETSLYLK
ncbi:soluble lytic murein transglycosylase-like protein (plasmid) [Desulfosporosinus acidiphilus SJ4]|uniref:Soluble lytic murein transglycosylase-like protein n=1 Tax=Desulfosporosinus acidiphilus (strain DSM 22704 / JCM 16185 / SJ4) TaxID=646529 RepID=I4DCU2_DESAJ|nr:transglycosylase SLT domain-containing protein [Desulfosporosinus acidiphilus]AFM43616.1 soluble lytic murein transglycosylase-like protein [Desulfosporosinus acidiphilus SJ4]